MESRDLQMWRVMKTLEEMRQQRDDDKNEVISFFNDLQQNYWAILDRMGFLWKGHRRTNDRLDDMKVHLTYVEFHAHHDLGPLAPNAQAFGHAPDFLH